MKQKRYFLADNELPTQWYNIQADMKNKPQPMLSPKTKEPITVDELSQLISREAASQELNFSDAWIDIPEPVLEMYRYYRSTPLVRAYGLEEALGTPAHIYFKNESVSPVGSHKLNSALPQAYYCKKEGATNKLQSEALSPQCYAGIRSSGNSFALNVYTRRKGYSYPLPQPSGLSWNSNLRGC